MSANPQTCSYQTSFLHVAEHHLRFRRPAIENEDIKGEQVADLSATIDYILQNIFRPDVRLIMQKTISD